MSTRGIYNRAGEPFGYLEGSRTYDLNGNQTGVVREQVIYDMDGNRRWQLDGDAVLDPRGNVIGYLGERVSHGEW
ncbi:MAG: hypothetical protein JXJ20_08645 [Anaerolineae bacterium]|jgi:hypothetical protein|nr:hypothetical protein [Anaerolineae bacterium]